VNPHVATLWVFRRLLRLQLHRLRNRLFPGHAGRRRSSARAGVGAGIVNVTSALVLGVLVLRGVRFMPAGPEGLGQAQPLWAFQLSALLLSMLFLTIATLRLADDGELLWFSALPLPAGGFFPYRVVMLAASRLIWIAPLWAFLHGVAIMRKETGEAACLALVMALMVHLVSCTAATVVELFLRGWFTRRAATRVQMGCLLAGGGLAALVFAPAVVEHPAVRDSAALVFGTIEWPATLAVRSLLARSTARSVALLFALTVQCAGFLFLLCLAGTSVLRRRGVAVSEGVRQLDGRGQRTAQRCLPLLGPFARRDLSLLARDSRYLLQSVTPLLVVMACVAGVVLGGARDIGDSPQALLLIALGTVTTVLLWSGAPLLGNESRAFWMLFTLPVDLSRFLARKAFQLGVRAWSVALLALLMVTRAHDPVTVLVPVAWAALAAAICAPLSVSISVLSFDRTTERPDQARLAAFVWLFLGVSALLAGAISLAPVAARLSILIFLGLLALAFWQRAIERFPLLLDVDDVRSHHSRVSVGDALVSLLTFNVVQQVANHLLGAPPLSPGLAIAAAASAGMTALWLRRRRVSYRPRLMAQPGSRALFRGAIGGGCCFLATWLIHVLARRWWPSAGDFWLGRTLAAGPGPDLLVFAILAAPAEEYLFRGMLLPAMRRSMPLVPSVGLSAVVFAAMHPAASVGPALILGIVCALLAERDRALAGAIIAHLIYNLGVCLVRL
jgi:membrane protease YdiL (CAAX protease family)